MSKFSYSLGYPAIEFKSSNSESLYRGGYYSATPPRSEKSVERDYSPVRIGDIILALDIFAVKTASLSLGIHIGSSGDVFAPAILPNEFKNRIDGHGNL